MLRRRLNFEAGSRRAGPWDPCDKYLTPNRTPCYVFVHKTSDLSFISDLFSFITISRSYHTQIASDCLVPLLLSLITLISNPPLYYLVADSLSSYQWLFLYHVRYIASQSGGTVGFGLCPLCLFTLLARGHPAIYKMYYYSTWTLSLSFRVIKTSKPRTKELHKSFDFPVSLLSAAA